MNKREKKICLHLWLPERLVKLLDDERHKWGKSRTDLIRDWLWGRILRSDKQVVIKSTKE